MEGKYDITLAEEPVGQAVVTREGLYYRFRCSCRLSGETICRLVAVCGGRQENLGIPVPEGDSYTLNCRMAVSRLGQGKLSIRVIPKHAPLGEMFVPISPEEPFGYISRLKKAHLARRGDLLGAVIEE